LTGVNRDLTGGFRLLAPGKPLGGDVQVLASGLPTGCGSPFTGAAGADNPVVFAWLVVTNSAFWAVLALMCPRCAPGLSIGPWFGGTNHDSFGRASRQPTNRIR
jgi:hypothetical protein